MHPDQPLETFEVADPQLYQDDLWRPYFARLRSEAPVHRCNDSPYGPYWSISTYDLVREVETNHGVFSNRADLGGIQIKNIAEGLDRPSFVSMDPPEHTPRRRAVAPIANHDSLLGYEDLIRRRTETVLDGLPHGEEFDWVQRVSKDLTAMMLATMLDFPQEQRFKLLYWSDVATANLSAPSPIVTTEEERYAELEKMADVFAELWRQRADGNGGFDLITMIANHEATKEMDRAEFIGTLFLLIVGGNDTTRNSMSGGLLASIENPMETEKVKNDLTLVPNLVHEVIRYQTPVIHMRRTALSDTEVGGQKIAKGDKVVLWYISANADDTIFEDAACFRIGRQNFRRHLSFGFGIHRCVGNALAELQLRILWEEILKRDLRFEIVGKPVRTYSNFIRGFESMIVKIS